MLKMFSRVKRFLLLVAFVLMMVPSMGSRASAQTNMIEAAKANKVKNSAGKLVTNSKGVRLKYKNGQYAKSTWVYYKKKVYCFKANGYACKGFFNYEGSRYYANKKGCVVYKKWIKKGSKKYYMKSNGCKAAGETLKLNGKIYTFNAKGQVVKNKSGKLKYLFVGDSRTVGMKAAVGGSKNAYIGKVSMGYNYLVSTADKKVREYLKEIPTLKVIFAFGINDLANVDKYIAYYQKMIKEYPKAQFFFMSINPISSWRTTAFLSNAKIKQFNKKLKAAFGPRYINTYSYLKKKGFSSSDGIHYHAATYKKIYNYVIKKIS